MSQTSISNYGLYRIHRVLFIAYIIFGLLTLLVLFAKFDVFIVMFEVMMLSLAAFHYYAANGVRDGNNTGHGLSRIFAYIIFLAIPLGTLMAMYIFKMTGKEKWEEGQGENSQRRAQ